MGYQLRRDLREVLGPDVTGLQRAVALEIADDANEETRITWVTLEDLARWTGAKDGAVVRNALKRLAAAGWEFRIPIGVAKKDGRVMYAKPGIRMTFRVPDFEGVAVATPRGRAGATPKGGGAGATPSESRGYSQGVAVATPIGGAGAHSEGAVATPSSSSPHRGDEEKEASSAATPVREVTAAEKKEFGNFWALYPKSKDYDKTLTEWTAAVTSGVDPQEIAAAAVAYAREVAGQEFRFIKYSANWIRERRYEDKYAPEPGPEGRPPLRAVSGDSYPGPWRNPTDQDAYYDPM